MKLYCVQHDIVWENKKANFTRVEALLAKTKAEPGSLVLLPEMFATGFSMNAQAIAEKRGGETEQFLAASAKRFNIFLLGGVVGAQAGGKPCNQCVVFSPDGSEVARYSKLQTFTPGGESDNYDTGKELVSF